MWGNSVWKKIDLAQKFWKKRHPSPTCTNTVQKLLNSWRKKIAHKSDAYGQKAQCLSFSKWYIMKSSVQPFLRKSKNKIFLLNKKIFLLSKQKNFLMENFLSWSICIIRFFLQTSKLINKKVEIGQIYFIGHFLSYKH